MKIFFTYTLIPSIKEFIDSRLNGLYTIHKNFVVTAITYEKSLTAAKHKVELILFKNLRVQNSIDI